MSPAPQPVWIAQVWLISSTPSAACPVLDRRNADLTDASFSTGFLANVDPSFKLDLVGADFSAALLQNAVGLGHTEGALYDAQTDFTNAWADLAATIAAAAGAFRESQLRCTWA